MAIKAQAIRCPNCGATLDWDGVSEVVKCMACQTIVPITDENRIKIEYTGTFELNEDKKYSNYMDLAQQAYSCGNMQEAYDYYTRALELKQDDFIPIFRKGLCTGYLCSDIGLGEKSKEMLSWINRAANMISDNKDRLLISEEIKKFARVHRTSNNNVFYSPQDCASYILGVYNKIYLLDQLFLYVDRVDEQGCIEFIEIQLNYCEIIKSPKFYQVKKNSPSKGNYTSNVKYSVNSNILSTTENIYRKFINIYNQYILPKMETTKAHITQTKYQISQLPTKFQIYHIIISKWVLIIGLIMLSAINSYLVLGILGVIVLVAWITFYIIYLVEDKDKNVRTLYKSLKSYKKSYATLKRKIKK